MFKTKLTLVVIAMVVGGAVRAEAAVLCAPRRTGQGALKVRDACLKGEVAIDPAASGLQGPPGEQGPAGSPAAAGPSLIGGGTGDVASSIGIGPFYVPMFDSRASSSSTQSGRIAQRIPVAGKIANLTVAVDIGPDDGFSRTFTLVTSATQYGTPVLSELACTITAGTFLWCNDDTHAATIAAGDFVMLRVTGLPVPATQIHWTATFTAG